MAHVLIAGMTLSGKTTLAREMCRSYKAAGVETLVLDPISDPRWPTEYRTSDQDEFLDWFWHSRSCVAFMDEGGESVGRYNEAMTKTATRGRHWGHRCVYIAQKPTQLAALVRDQCTTLYLFACSRKTGELLAEEWNHPELAECDTLKTGEFFYAVKMGPVSRHSLFAQPKESDNAADPNDSGRRHSRRGRRSAGNQESGDGRTGTPEAGSAEAGSDPDAT